MGTWGRPAQAPAAGTEVFTETSASTRDVRSGGSSPSPGCSVFGVFPVPLVCNDLIPAYTSTSNPSQYTSQYNGADELYNNSSSEGSQSMVYRAPYMVGAHNAFCKALGASCP